MESARPHYVESWPPILHAATLWLNAKGFEMENNNQEDEKTAFSNNNPNNNNNNDENVATSKTNTNVERFHLLFGMYTSICMLYNYFSITWFTYIKCLFITTIIGICMEALCSPRSSESPQNIETCLNALHTLLDSAWARKVFVTDRSLPIELCNVLHRYVCIMQNLYSLFLYVLQYRYISLFQRLLLTRESYVIQMLVMEVLKQVMKAAQEDLATKKKLKLEGIRARKF